MGQSDKLAIDGGTPVIRDPLPAGRSGPAGGSVVGEEEIAAVTNLLRNDPQLFRYARKGEADSFEIEAADFLGVKYAHMVSSGTSALVCALTAIGAGPGDEVIVPGYTYIADPAAVIAVGAVPVIAEIDESLGLDPSDVERKITPYTKAIIPVHMQGVVSRMDDLMRVAREHGLKVVEDCSQYVGGDYKGRKAGTYGDVGTWSLQFSKTITAGEGGLVFTDDLDIYERACLAADPGLPMWNKETVWHNQAIPRQTYRISEVSAAIARVQLGKIEAILSHRRSLKRAFLDALEEPRSYGFQHVDDPAGDTGATAAIIVQDIDLARGYQLALQAEGVDVATMHNEGFPDRHIYSYWDSILAKHSPHPTGYPWKDPSYKGDVEYSKDMCPQTLSLLGRSIRFDFNMNMTEGQVRAMAAALNKVDAALGG